MSLAALAVLAALPYLRALTLPLISDDYLVIGLARKYGPIQAWVELLADPLYRNRATSILLTHWMESVTGLWVLPFNLVSVGLHILNTWLIFAFGAYRRIGWRLAGLTAGCFAVLEGHQEAVIWFSALPELLVFFFSLTAIWLWLRWLERGGAAWYWGANGCFVLALFSKESAVAIAVVLTALFWHRRPARGQWVALVPIAGCATLYTMAAFLGKTGNQHFFDGTFHLAAPFVTTIVNSIGRMFWIWGALSLVPLLWWRPRGWKVWIALATIWMAVTLLPYSFLTYMTRVPSRHTYLPSLGVALVVALAAIELFRHSRRRWVPLAVCGLLVVHNCVYLWTYKHRQFVERAKPTEALIEHVRDNAGQVFVESFPYNEDVLNYTVEIGAGKPREILILDRQNRSQAQSVFTYQP